MANTDLQKLVNQVEIKSDGDVFHEIFRQRPHHISTMSPSLIQNVDIHDGHDWGTVGSIIYWNFTHDGKEKVAKEIIREIDEEKKLVKYEVLEGDIKEHYKTFFVTVHVDTEGENNLVTWTFEYEKMNADVEDPTSLMDFCIAVSKDIETHHLVAN
ncbi:kirola-like [Impatiens glandulifera]|uniref:kirola-like n=1 Tax=Impatiens glandulifera TaxID=253017 RepID=UPI001FB0A727|nr:kirola-like [Impatiens glandulifera]